MNACKKEKQKMKEKRKYEKRKYKEKVVCERETKQGKKE